MAATPKKGGDLADFRRKFDKKQIIPQKIKAALAELGEGWEVEADFIRRAGISNAEYGRFKDQFEPHFINVRLRGVRRRVVAGTVKFAARLRGIMGE